MQNLWTALVIGWGAYKALRKGYAVELLCLPQTVVAGREEMLNKLLVGWSEEQFYRGAYTVFAFVARTELEHHAQFFTKKPGGHIKPIQIFSPPKDNVVPFPTPPKV